MEAVRVVAQAMGEYGGGWRGGHGSGPPRRAHSEPALGPSMLEWQLWVSSSSSSGTVASLGTIPEVA